MLSISACFLQSLTSACLEIPLTESQKQSRYKYAKANLKRIPLDVQKEKYEEIARAAGAAGESINGYIKKAIDARLSVGKDQSQEGA